MQQLSTASLQQIPKEHFRLGLVNANPKGSANADHCFIQEQNSEYPPREVLFKEKEMQARCIVHQSMERKILEFIFILLNRLKFIFVHFIIYEYTSHIIYKQLLWQFVLKNILSVGLNDQNLKNTGRDKRKYEIRSLP